MDEDAMEELVDEAMETVDNLAADLSLEDAAEFYESVAYRASTNATATRDDIARKK